MPSWCENRITINAESEEEMATFLAAVAGPDGPFDFNTICPIPVVLEHGAEGRLEQVGPLVAAAGVDADDTVRGPGLGAQAVDHDGQPAGAVVAHHEGGDRPLTCPGHDRRQ